MVYSQQVVTIAGYEHAMTVPDNNNNLFGKWVKQTRKARRITQDGLAVRVGCAFETIRKIEAGTRKPSEQVAELIARALDVPEDEIPALVEQARGGPNSALIPRTNGNGVAGSIAREAAKQDIELPWPLNSEFVGREQEVAAISNLLVQNGVRLLTMLGAGGIGKTRLALEVARACKDHFEDGSFAVFLSAISNPELFMSGVLAGLNLHGTSGPGQDSDPREAVYNFLRERQALILLDNMEHLLACAPQVTALLQNCPKLKILVTSREPLHISGEKQYTVPPLSNAPMEIPIKGVAYSEAELFEANHGGERPDAASYYGQYEAVQLFVKRAQDVDRSFELTDENAYFVARICWELDGLPLAIELAASQSKMLTPKALHKRISKQLRLAMRGANDLPDRQRTLRGAIDWSYGLLNETERKLFRRLGGL